MNGTLTWYVDVSEVRRGPRDAPECGRVEVIRRHWFGSGIHAEEFRDAQLLRKKRGFPIDVSDVVLPPYTVRPAP